MKTTIILSSLLLLLFPIIINGEVYSDSLGRAEFSMESKIKWEKDDAGHDMGLGTATGSVVKGTVVLLNTFDKSKLDWDIKTFPDSMLEDLAKEKNYKKERDITKKMDDGAVKRYVESSYTRDGKKVRVYFLGVEDKEHLATVMMTCNNDGKHFKKGQVNKVLQSLKLKK